MEPRKISDVIMFGDSLMDRGAMNERYLFGIIPMRWIAGLQSKTGGDSFTNGFTWSDYFIAAIASEFTINKLKNERHFDTTDIADAILTKDSHVQPIVSNYYNLKNHASVDFLGKSFIQDYTEGGLTAHDYSWMPSTSISRFFSRLILSTLAAKRKELLQYNLDHHVTLEEKEKTLIVEWTGANDLITVNAKPSKSEVDKAICARMKNVIELMKNGYSNFILFNQPDLALTPRFQAKSKKERRDASRWCKYFNKRLEVACAKLRKNNSHCVLEIFDVASEFNNLFYHPEVYGLDPDKLMIPFTKSEDFEIKKDGTSPANGYMFWDDVHPTADSHAFLGFKFFEQFRRLFNFVEPINERKITYTDDLGIEYFYQAPKQAKFEECRLISFFGDQRRELQKQASFVLGSRTKVKEKAVVNDARYTDKEVEKVSYEINKAKNRYSC